PGAVVRAHAHVGNFAELKNTTLGPESAVGHFSYLGDATIGARVNIAAGTITANSAGTPMKKQTEIGDDAFIGCDTTLVAPIRVGAGGVTVAGAVVTHDVEDGTLVVGIPARPMRRKIARSPAAEEEK